MRRKALLPEPPAAAAPREQLRGELESLGMTPAQAEPLAEQLVELAKRLPRGEYRALLDGVALGRRAGQSATPAAPELSRILEDFASELKKLDEGLRVLAAFLARLRGETEATPRSLH